jgi:hypothetical protein
MTDHDPLAEQILAALRKNHSMKTCPQCNGQFTPIVTGIVFCLLCTTVRSIVAGRLLDRGRGSAVTIKAVAEGATRHLTAIRAELASGALKLDESSPTGLSAPCGECGTWCPTTGTEHTVKCLPCSAGFIRPMTSWPSATTPTDEGATE